MPDQPNGDADGRIAPSVVRKSRGRYIDFLVHELEEIPEEHMLFDFYRAQLAVLAWPGYAEQR